MNILRRKVLASVAAFLPAFAVAKGAQAWTKVSAEQVGLVPATGSWATLEHVTDGTDPSTAIIAPPNFTAEIQKLEGHEITLTGYLQSVSSGFGKKQDYLLSRNSFHCPYCYGFGRGSLVLATFESHAPQTNKKVTVKGTLALQKTDPADFYFQLKNASIA